MEQNFQTSFIPKKPMIEKRAVTARSVGIFTIIAIFVLFTVLLASGALYFYKGVLTKNITEMQLDLNLAQKDFEPSKITELKLLDKRLKASSEILSKHVTVTPIFQALADVTMKTVRYTKFSYEAGAGTDAITTGTGTKILVKMNGLAVGYRSVALQSDLFAENKNLIDPIFSNLSLDDKGNVLFDLEFSVDPSFVDYKQMILTQI